jgi:threonine aldolase
LGTLFSELNIVTEILPIETNIVIIRLDPKFLANDIVDQWSRLGLKTSPFGKHQIRLVTHLDFSEDDLAKVRQVLTQFQP